MNLEVFCNKQRCHYFIECTFDDFHKYMVNIENRGHLMCYMKDKLPNGKNYTKIHALNDEVLKESFASIPKPY